MTLTLYHLKACDTCRKAIKALENAGHELNLIDVRADGVPLSELEKIVEEFGWETAVNRRSTTWRGLSDEDKADLDTAKAVALLRQHPTLMKRPVIQGPDKATIGWTKNVQEHWL